jgi:Na+/H+ antiporter NhaD/arsenite permease-like protein
MNTSQTLTLMIFLVTYAGIAVGHIGRLKLDRTGIALLGTIALLATGVTPLDQALSYINFPSLILLFSLMIASGELQKSGFYHWVALRIAGELNQPRRFLFLLMVTTGLLSAFLNNDVICFAFTPVVTGALLRKRLNPIPFLMGLAFASNIGCALTIIGNAQNVVIGQIAHLEFGRYMLWAAVPVCLSFLGAYGVILWITKNEWNIPVGWDFKTPPEKEISMDWYNTWKGLVVIGLMVALFFTTAPRYLIGLVGAGILLTSTRIKSQKILKRVSWQLLILFTGLFVVVGAFEASGLAQKMLASLNQWGLNLANPYLLTLSTGILSNLINNSAAVMLLVHIVDLSQPLNGYLLALSNTFAGNLLVIGSVANLVVLQGAGKFNIRISFMQFARYGIPTVVLSFLILLGWTYVALYWRVQTSTPLRSGRQTSPAAQSESALHASPSELPPVLFPPPSLWLHIGSPS